MKPHDQIFLVILYCFQTISVSIDYYTTDHYGPYTWVNSYPQSCECIKTGYSTTECNVFKCTCICDITASECDYGCCCDVDCSQSQVSRFQDLKSCLPEGFSPYSENICYSSDELQRVNPKPPMTGESTAQLAVDQLLCIDKKNYAFKGEFYDTVGIQPSSVFNTDGGKKTYDYVPQSSIAISRDAFYDQNDTLPAFINSTSTHSLLPLGKGLMRQPQPASDGLCNDENFAKFEVSRASECIRGLSCSSESVFIAQCRDSFSLSDWTSRLFVARRADTSWTSALSTSLLAAVEVVGVSFEDFSTGNTKDITSIWLRHPECDTTVLNTSSPANKTACEIQLQSLGTIVGLTCVAALKSISYTVTHDQSIYSKISSIKANITVTNIPYAKCASSVDTLFLQQTYSMVFTDSQAVSNTSKSYDMGNLVHRSKSGNPGYLRDRPVLFAVPAANSSSKVLDEVVTGFSIPSPLSAYDTQGAGIASCPSSLTLLRNRNYSDYDRNITIGFGSDVISGCVLRLNRNELEELCCTGTDTCSGTYSSSFSTTSGIPIFLVPTSGYIGNFGNADPLDRSQWQSISTPSLSTSTSTRRWDGDRGLCSNMITGLNYKFLVAYTGEKSNPQNKIISVAASYTFSNWIFRKPYPNEVQSFPLSVTVTFIYSDSNKIRGYTPPTPPILFKVPYDVFYPFSVSSAPSSFPRTWHDQSIYAMISVLIISCTIIFYS